jgi:histidine triad protein
VESVFTTIIRDEGRVFVENEHAFAFPTNIPITPGHSLVCPRRVVETIDELTTEELVSLFELLELVKGGLRAVVGAEGFNCAWNEGGKPYGQSVPHLHIHVVPRTPGDAGIYNYDPRQFLYRPGDREEASAEALKEFVLNMQQELR